MKKFALLLTSSLLIGFAATAHSAIVTEIDLRGSGGKYDFDSNTATRTLFYNGLQIDFAGFYDAAVDDDVYVPTVLNSTAASFGINAAGTGDDTDAIDGDNGDERVVFTFSKVGGVPYYGSTLNSIRVNSNGLNDLIFWELIAPNGTENGYIGDPLLNGSADSGTLITLANQNLDLTGGATLSLTWDNLAAGNGIGIAALILNVDMIPEPSTFALFAAGALVTRLRRRRRIK